MQLYVGLEAIGEADAKGMRTVMTTLNGQLRPVYVRDRSIKVDVAPGREGRHVQARPGRRAVLGRRDAQGRPSATPSTAGQPVASIEAMKMEAAITAPVDGVVERLAIGETQQVEAGDLLVVIRPAPVAWRVRHPARTTPFCLEIPAVTPDRNDQTHDDADEHARTACSPTPEASTPTGLGSSAAQTEQVSVVLPSELR